MSSRRFLPSLRRPPAPAAPERKEAVDRRHSAGPAYAFPGNPYMPITDVDLDRVIQNWWERDGWVWRAVDARAKNASGLDIVVQDARGRKGKPIEGHPIADVLNGQANPYESALEFRWRLQMLLDLSVTRGVPVEVTESHGILARVDILNPLHTYPIPDPDTFIEKWEMRHPNGEVFDELFPYVKGKGGVLWFKRPHPTDPYSSTSWIRAAGLSIDLDYWARRYNLNFLFNDGRPGGVLAIKPVGSGADDYDSDGITEEDATVLQASIRGGPDNAGRVAIIEADSAEFFDMSQSPRDAQYVEGRQITQREILVFAGTPLSVIGDASGRTFDNADAEDHSFWKREMKPELRLQANTWDKLTTGGLADTREVVDYDWSQVGLFDREDMANEAAMRVEVAAGTRSIDSYLEETGREPMNLPGTRVLWFDNGKAPIGTPEDVTALLTQGNAPPAAGPAPAAGELDAGGTPPALPPGTSATDPSEADILDAEIVDPLDETAYAVKALRGLDDGLADRRRREHARLVDHWVDRVADETKGLLGRQEKVVLTRLRGSKARKHTRHWDYGPEGTRGREMKALDPEYVVDRRTWVTQALDVLVDLVEAAFGAAGTMTAKQLAGPSFDAGAKTGEIVATTVRAIAEGLDARAGRLQQVIADREAAGDDIDGIAAHVVKAFTSSGTWSETTSRAVVGAMNAASLISAVNSGAVAKRWLATEDERTRKTHRDAEGQVVAIEGKFAVGDAALLFPHDPTGPASEVINCRCTMLYGLGRKTAAQEEADLDADLAALDAAEVEWKIGRFGGFRGRFDPKDHPRDQHGRFLDVPEVRLPDGTTGQAVSLEGDGRVVVARADGGVETVDADRLDTTDPVEADPAPADAVPSEGERADRRADDSRAGPGEFRRLREAAGGDPLWRARPLRAGEAGSLGVRADLAPHAVAVHEPGPGVREAYAAVGADASDLVELDPAGAGSFRAALEAARAANPNGAAVYVYGEDEYAAMRLLLAPDGSAGVAVKADGDIVSVFANPAMPGRPRQALASLVEAAADAGGTHLDAFDGFLPKAYGTHGFRAVARVAFDEEQAPPDWPAGLGQPDVVFMVRDPAAGGYAAGDGEPVGDYDAGVAAAVAAAAQ